MTRISASIGATLLALSIALLPRLSDGKKHLQRRTPRPSPGAREREEREGERELGQIRAREAWHLAQRALPGHAIPPGAYQTARRDFEALRSPSVSNPLAHSGAAFATASMWRELGPSPSDPPPATPNSGPITGRMRAVAVTPDGKTIYVGAAQGGVWRSDDAGASWTALGDAQPSLAIGALAIDPRDPKTVYAGTGESSFGYYGAGLLKSTDGGKSWTQPAGNQFAGAATTRIAIDPGTRAIYLATSAGSQGVGDYCTGYYVDQSVLGLWRSTDDGKSWTRLAAGGVTSFVLDTTVTPRELFFHVSNVGGFHLVDGGTPQPLALPNAQSKPRLIAMELAMAPSSNKILYAGVGLGGNNPAGVIYVSQDHGATWSPINNTPNYCYSQCDYSNALAVSPTDPGTLFIGGGLCSVFRLTGGTSVPSFKAVSMPSGTCDANFGNWPSHYVHPDAHQIVFSPTDPTTIYVVTDGGIFRGSGGGASWKSLNSAIGVVQFYGICVDPKDANRVFGGAQDNGTLLRDGNPPTWSGLFTGDGGPCVAAASSGGMIHEVISDTFASIFVPDGSGSYTPTFDAYPGFCQQGDPGCGDRTAFIAPVVGDPSDPSVVYAGTHRLWRSSDGAMTWAAISPDLTEGMGGEKCVMGGAQGDYLTAIAAAPSDGKTIYTGSAGGRVSVTRDGGATWKAVSGALPGRWVAGLAVDPARADVAWVAFSGFSSSTASKPGHVFRTQDGGVTWAPRDPAMDAPVNSIAVHPVDGNLVVAGTDLGTIWSADAGATWTPLEGLPNVAVYSIAWQDAKSTLVVGTHGRGAWSRAFVPTIAVQPARLDLKMVAVLGDGGTGASGDLAVSGGDPGATLHATVTSAAPWLKATPTTGRASGATPLAVHVSADAMAIGEYDAMVHIADPAASNGALDVPVHLSVVAAPSSGGCGCAVGGAPRRAGAALAIAFLLLLALARRRR